VEVTWVLQVMVAPDREPEVPVAPVFPVQPLTVCVLASPLTWEQVTPATFAAKAELPGTATAKAADPAKATQAARRAERVKRIKVPS
jgi:hypothetical protein